MALKNTNEAIVNAVSVILKDNIEWISRYEDYADSIKTNESHYGENAKKFRVLSPLYAYSSITKVKDKSTTSSYDLRFAGQSVGSITVNKKNVIKLKVDKSQVKCAVENFGYNRPEGFSSDWNGPLAIEYRSCFYRQKISDSIHIHSKEHRIENWMLAEFGKKTRAEKKLLCNIQPVRLGGKFFQLATPLGASNHDLALYSGIKGGGIDILARVKHSPKDHRLAVIELKDENKNEESQAMALQQALSYATFLANLLRSTSGKKWWNIFNRHTEIPEILKIDAVTLMPEGDSEIGSLTPIRIDELGVELHPHTLFYKANAESGNPEKIYGTLKEALANKGE